MNQPDWYATLGLTPVASRADITHAYRLLLRRHHPDTRAPGDPAQQARSDAKLSAVIAAYAVLGDEDRRAAYDRGVAGKRRQVTNAEGHQDADVERRRNADVERREHHGVHSDPPIVRRRRATGGGQQPPIVAGPVFWSPPRRRS